MRRKRIIYTVLCIIWMMIIFLFSNQNATTSQSTSDKVASGIVGTIEVITNQEMGKEEKYNWIENIRFIVRKSAHFFLYFVLGIFVYGMLSSYAVSKAFLFSIAFCFLYACSDEIHQIFSVGRTAKILDILIDTSGSFVGSLLCFAIRRFNYK